MSSEAEAHVGVEDDGVASCSALAMFRPRRRRRSGGEGRGSSNRGDRERHFARAHASARRGLRASLLDALEIEEPAAIAGVSMGSVIGGWTFSPSSLAIIGGLPKAFAEGGVDGAKTYWRESALFAHTRRHPPRAPSSTR